MGLLDTNAETLDQTASNSFSAPAAPPEPGVFHNFGSSAGNYFMRSMAEAGRAGSMALAAVPVALDWAVNPDTPTGEALGMKQKPLADRYFRWHDETFGRAVDHWTPRPSEVGAAGQIVGQLSGGIVKFLASPALSVADAQLSTAEDLVRQGVDATTAQAAGGIAGLSAAIGMRAPAAIGNTALQRVGSGAAINVVQGAAAAEATRLVLQAGGAPDKVAAQFDPLDMRARTVDALMGAVFGAKAHYDASTQVQRDALLLVNQAMHLESVSLPGRPVAPGDLTAGVDNTRQAIDQMLRGEPVAVDSPLPAFHPDPEAEAYRRDMAAIAGEVLPQAAPIKVADMLGTEAPPRPAGEAGAAATEPAAQFPESVRVMDVDPATGQERAVSANEVISRTKADAAQAETTAPGLFKTAAECLLGSL